MATRYLADMNNPRHYPNGAVGYMTPGPWKRWAEWRNVPCADGKRRTVYATGEADTFFSIPATTRVQGRWVSGFISMASGAWNPAHEGPEFHRVLGRKNSALLPSMPDEMDRADAIRAALAAAEGKEG